MAHLSLSQVFLVFVSEMAVRLQSTSTLSPLLSSSPQHSAFFQPTIILTLRGRGFFVCSNFETNNNVITYILTRTVGPLFFPGLLGSSLRFLGRNKKFIHTKDVDVAFRSIDELHAHSVLKRIQLSRFISRIVFSFLQWREYIIMLLLTIFW